MNNKLKKELIYIVVELHQENKPKIIDVFRSKKQAEKCAYEIGAGWRNIIEKELK